MKIHDVVQGSQEWLSLRLGIPTSSEFAQIITPSKGELSKSANKYAYRLIAETVLNMPLVSLDHLEWIARGKEMEPLAVKQYQFTYDAEVRAVGFITTDDGRMGCSPDRLIVGQNGAVEIKCPAPQTHIGYLVDGPGDDYRPQVQGQLLIAELDFVDFYSFHPSMPPVLIRTARDEPYLRKMSAALTQFCEMKDGMLEKARAAGFFDGRKSIVPPIDDAYDEFGYAGEEA